MTSPDLRKIHDIFECNNRKAQIIYLKTQSVAVKSDIISEVKMILANGTFAFVDTLYLVFSDSISI
jgi:hypothetical protein